MLYGHGEHEEDGEAVGRPALDMIWTQAGDAHSESGERIDRTGLSVTVERYEWSFADATLSGQIGALGFDPALSRGWTHYEKTAAYRIGL